MSQQNRLLAQRWRELLAQAIKNPWWAAHLLRRSSEIFNRYAVYYRLLAKRLARYGWRVRRPKIAAAIAGAALAMALNGQIALAGNITVTGQNPILDCTLREAILSANTDIALGGCTISGAGPADTINLPSNSSLTYYNAPYFAEGNNALPSVISPITIQGNGAVIERGSSSPYFRLLHVSTLGGNLTLADVTIAGGGELAGGGIFNEGQLTLQDSRVTGNHATFGGGILNDNGNVTINDSDIVSNTVYFYSGPYDYYHAFGGGIYNYSGTLTIRNSTVEYNTAIGCSCGPEPYYGLGGGIFNTGYDDFEITSQAQPHHDQLDQLATHQKDGPWANNLKGETESAAAFQERLREKREQQQGPLQPQARPQIDLQQRNFSLAPGLPLAFRNRPRVEQSDVAAQESSIVTIVDSSISFNNADTDGGGIYNTYGTVIVSESTIEGNSAGSDGGGILNDELGALVVSSSVITGNSASRGGGINNFEGYVTLTESDLVNNSAPNRGGGLNNFDGNVLVVDSLISGNYALSGLGGGLFNCFGTVTLANNLVIGNQAISGGGLANCIGLVTINDSSFISNTAIFEGGGLLNSGVGSIANSTLSGNTASTNGGGIYNDEYGDLSLTNVTLHGNVAGGEGGGIFNNYSPGNSGTVAISNTLVLGNIATAILYNDASDDGGSAPFTSNGFNLVGNAALNFASSEVITVPVNTILNPNLSPAGNTLAHFLVAGSPALDAGNNADAIAAGLTTDQRGAARFQGTVDIGAIEGIGLINSFLPVIFSP